MVFSLLFLVAIGATVAVLVSRGGAGAAEVGDDDGHTSLRRVFVYSLALLGAVLTASGLSSVLRAALKAPGATTLISGGRGLALGLALTIVGLPVWVLAWRAAGGAAQRVAGERRSRGRRLFLAAVRLIALSVAVFSAIRVGVWLVGVEPYEAGAVARLLVWGALWAYYEHVAREVPFGSPHTRSSDRLAVYLAATAGFGLLTFAVVSMLSRSLAEVYKVLAGSEMLVSGPALELDLRPAAVTGVVGVAVWVWHWLLLGRRDTGSTGWFVYVFLVGVLSGTVTAVVSGSVLLHRVLAWLLDATDEAAAIHFDVVAPTVAGVIVGVAVWGYHRAVLRESDAQVEGWSSAERAYRYLLTAAGMVTAASGVATILAVALDVAVPGRSLVEAPGGVRDVVAIGLTLLGIGVPLWVRFWSTVQRRVHDRPVERTALARRVLIFGAFGAAIVVTVVALSVLLLELFDALLAGRLAVDLIAEQRWSIALVLTAGAISLHYGLVLREDRAQAPAEPRRAAPRQVVVVAPASAGLGRRLTERLDAKVTVWDRSDVAGESLADAVVDTVDEQVRQATASRVLVLVEGDGVVRTVPLDD